MGDEKRHVDHLEEAARKAEADLRDEKLGPVVEKYLKGVDGVSTENRLRILRLIENLTLGTAAVGYRTESMHGAGSPQAQRIMISRQSNLLHKKSLALVRFEQIERLVGISENKIFKPVFRRQICGNFRRLSDKPQKGFELEKLHLVKRRMGQSRKRIVQILKMKKHAFQT